MASPTPKMHGVMWKRGRRMHKTLQRWFAIKDGDLMYATAENKEPNKTIPLARCSIKLGTTETELPGVGRCFPLEVDVEGGHDKQHVFYLKSQEERQRWFTALRSAAVAHNVTNVYNVSKELGQGAFSEVKLGEDKATGEKWALKIMKRAGMGDVENEMLAQETGIMATLNHPNIVKLHEVLETQYHIYLVLEYLSGGELFDRIVGAPEGHYTEKDACMVTQQLMRALEYLHEQNICHRDLKPENFLLVDTTPGAVIKIADFGFATHVPQGGYLRDVCGSPGYIAPEMLNEQGYDTKADMWSMGVILYILLTGIPPFAGADDKECFALTKRGEYDRQPLRLASEPAGDLVIQMLAYDPRQRLSAKQCNLHVWLSGREMSETPLTHTQKNLRSLMVRRRLKKAVLATMATTKMAHLLRLSTAAKQLAADPTAQAAAPASQAAIPQQQPLGPTHIQPSEYSHPVDAGAINPSIVNPVVSQPYGADQSHQPSSYAPDPYAAQYAAPYAAPQQQQQYSDGFAYGR